MELVLTPDMMVVLAILAITIVLFVSDVLPVDLAALSILVLLALTGYCWPILYPGHELFDIKNDLFSGFSSNAVMAIIAVMILGEGLNKSGIMNQLAGCLVKVGGDGGKRIMPLLSGSAAVISSFMQNIGVAALLLPVANFVALRTGLSMSQLLMPLGFCTILGGTITMIGSSSLILVNDLIANANNTLPADTAPMKTFGLFEISPIGIALAIAGIAYFMMVGKWLLPKEPARCDEDERQDNYLRRVYGLCGEIHELVIPPGSPLIGKHLEAVEEGVNRRVIIIACCMGKETLVSPAWNTTFSEGDILAVVADQVDAVAFARMHQLLMKTRLERFADMLNPVRAGIGEIVIPPRSSLNGKTLRDIRFRKNYGLSILAVYRGEHALPLDFDAVCLQSGDTLVVHSLWDNFADIGQNPNFVLITRDFPNEPMRPDKIPWALVFFILSLGLALFTNLPLSVALFTGAVGMILTRVISIDEAYHAISWQTVFLLASLIPLGIAMEKTATAAWLAQNTVDLFGDLPVWMLQTGIALLATGFTLVMSNVGATILLVPLAINIAIIAGADPRVFAITAALATSNSFILPTNQVNALLMGPGGYQVKDYMRVGSMMTVLFLVVLIGMLNLVY